MWSLPGYFHRLHHRLFYRSRGSRSCDIPAVFIVLPGLVTLSPLNFVSLTWSSDCTIACCVLLSSPHGNKQIIVHVCCGRRAGSAIFRLFLIGEATFCSKNEENVNLFTFFLFVERFSLKSLDILEFRICAPVCLKVMNRLCIMKPVFVKCACS